MSELSYFDRALLPTLLAEQKARDVEEVAARGYASDHQAYVHNAAVELAQKVRDDQARERAQEEADELERVLVGSTVDPVDMARFEKYDAEVREAAKKFVATHGAVPRGELRRLAQAGRFVVYDLEMKALDRAAPEDVRRAANVALKRLYAAKSRHVAVGCQRRREGKWFTCGVCSRLCEDFSRVLAKKRSAPVVEREQQPKKVGAVRSKEADKKTSVTKKGSDSSNWRKPRDLSRISVLTRRDVEGLEKPVMASYTEYSRYTEDFMRYLELRDVLLRDVERREEARTGQRRSAQVKGEASKETEAATGKVKELRVTPTEVNEDSEAPKKATKGKATRPAPTPEMKKAKKAAKNARRRDRRQARQLEAEKVKMQTAQAKLTGLKATLALNRLTKKKDLPKTKEAVVVAPGPHVEKNRRKRIARLEKRKAKRASAEVD